MLFFIPEISREVLQLQKLIEKHGGIVVYIAEGCCFQITTLEIPDLSIF